MPARRCESCHYNRMQFVLDGQHSVCRAERICDKVDGRTLELAFSERGRLSLSAIGLLGEQITDGHAQARQAAEYFGQDVPKTVEALMAAAERLHYLIFGPTGLTYAGRIRSEGDQEVVVDRGATRWQVQDAANRPTVAW